MYCICKKGDKPKQPYVTERTWHLVRFRKWLLKTIKVPGNPVVLLADVHSVMWQFVSSSFLKEPWCHTDPLFIELYMFAVWSFDACVVNYHPAWQVFCRSLAFAFLEVAEDAQLTMELLRNPLLSEHEQRVCNVRSALLSLIRYCKRLLSQWISADKVAFLEGIAGGVGEAVSAGASREAWQKIKCLLAWGGKKRKPRPHARKCVDGSVAQSFVEIANTIQGHFATVECAKSHVSGTPRATAQLQACNWHGCWCFCGGAEADPPVPDWAEGGGRPVCAFH